MMDKGLIRRDDPAMLAFAYTTPISALIHLCDREPEKTEACFASLERACTRRADETATNNKMDNCNERGGSSKEKEGDKR